MLAKQMWLLFRFNWWTSCPTCSRLHYKVEVLDFEELGMEAIWKIEIKDFPAFVVVDDKGNNFFDSVTRSLGKTIPVGPESG